MMNNQRNQTVCKVKVYLMSQIPFRNKKKWFSLSSGLEFNNSDKNIWAGKATYQSNYDTITFKKPFIPNGSINFV